MIQINVTDREGRQQTLSGKPGRSLMAVLRDEDMLEASCGGQCACATCHVHLDPAWLAATGERSELENDLLSSSFQLTETSRLSCQITLDDTLDGLTLVVAESEG